MNNDLTTTDLVKVGFGVLLLGVWVTLVALRLEAVAGVSDLVAFCKLGLTGLAAHYLTNYTPTVTPPPAGTTVITSTSPTGSAQ